MIRATASTKPTVFNKLLSFSRRHLDSLAKTFIAAIGLVFINKYRFSRVLQIKVLCKDFYLSHYLPSS